MAILKTRNARKIADSELVKDIGILSFFILIAAIILPLFVTSPFKGVDHDGAGGCFLGAIARNYVRYGYLATKFGWVENGGLLTPSEFRYYTHHPSLTPLILSLGLRIFGVHEWSIRMVFILFALGVLGLLYFLARDLWNRKVAILSCIFTLLTPMYLHFSSVPELITIALFFSLATIYFYAHWLKTESPQTLTVMAITFLLATQSAWEAYYLVPAILVHNFLRDKKKIINFLIPCLGIATFSIYLIHSLALGGLNQLMGTYRAAKWRSGVSIIRRDPWFVLTYLRQILVWMWYLFTPFLVISTVLFLVIYFGYSKEHRRKRNYDFALLFLIFGLLNYFIFIQLCYYHPQRLYYFIPCFVLSASLAVNHILDQIKRTSTKLPFISLLISLILLTVLLITKPVFLMLHENDARQFFTLSGYKFHNDDTDIVRSYNELKAYVQTKLGSTDILLTNSWYPQLRFYLDINTIEEIKSVEQLQEALNIIYTGKKKAMMIFNNSVDKSSNEIELLKYLKNNFALVQSYSKESLLIFDLNRDLSTVSQYSILKS